MVNIRVVEHNRSAPMDRTIYQISVPCLLECLKLLRIKWSQPSSFLTALRECGDRVRAKIASPVPERQKKHSRRAFVVETSSRSRRGEVPRALSNAAHLSTSRPSASELFLPCLWMDQFRSHRYAMCHNQKKKKRGCILGRTTGGYLIDNGPFNLPRQPLRASTFL